MSVAFTREEDVEAAAAHLPDRPVSPHRNLVTRTGLADLEARLAAARAAFTKTQASGEVRTDRLAMAQAARDVRYYSARRASAELVELPPGDTVRFGTTVTVERANGRRQSFRIVGEDEADAAAGSVSHISPMAVALLGKAVGNEAVVAGSPLEIVNLA